MKQQRAFTLIEMLVTLAVMAILAMLAAPGFQDFQRSNLLSSHTNTLVAALQTAKNEAIKRNEPTYMTPLSSGWSSGWRVYVDTDFDGSYAEGTDVIIIEQAALPNQLILTNTGSSSFITFNGSGFPKEPTTLNLQLSGYTGQEAVKNTRRVKIAKTGRIRSCKPTSAEDSLCENTAE